MADAGILVAWGKPVPGRERMAAALFKEAVEMWTELERKGEIESFETVSLEPHGDLNDFFLLRGDPDQLARLRVSEEFMRLGDRANMVLWNLRIVGARVGGASWGKIEEFEKAAGQLPQV